MDDEQLEKLKPIGLGLVGLVVTLVALFILFNPGPLALSDRVPFALIFLIPGVIALDQTRKAIRS